MTPTSNSPNLAPACLRKLATRRVSGGWWSNIWDTVPEIMTYSLDRHYYNSWFDACFRLLRCFLSGLLLGICILLVLIALSSTQSTQDPLTLPDLTLLLTLGLLFAGFDLFINWGAPASSRQITSLDMKLATHPELLPIVAKWVNKRGFLTTRDLFLIHRYCEDSAQQASRGTYIRYLLLLKTKGAEFCRMVLSTPKHLALVRRWMGKTYHTLVLKISNYRVRVNERKESRARVLDQSILVPYIQAESLHQDTSNAPSETPTRRL